MAVTWLRDNAGMRWVLVSATVATALLLSIDVAAVARAAPARVARGLVVDDVPVSRPEAVAGATAHPEQEAPVVAPDESPRVRPERPLEIEVVDMETGAPVENLVLDLGLSTVEESCGLRYGVQSLQARRTDAAGRARWWPDTAGAARVGVWSHSYRPCSGDLRFRYDPQKPRPDAIRLEVVPTTHLVVRVVNPEGLPIDRCTIRCESERRGQVADVRGADGATFECALAVWERVHLVVTRDNDRRSIDLAGDGSSRIERVLTLPGPGVRGTREPEPLPLDAPATFVSGPFESIESGLDGATDPTAALHVAVLDTDGRAVPGAFLAVEGGRFVALLPPQTNQVGAWSHWFARGSRVEVALRAFESPGPVPSFAKRVVTLPAEGEANVLFRVRSRLVVLAAPPDTGAYRAGLREGDSIESWQGRRPLSQWSIPEYSRTDVRIAVNRDGKLLHLTLPAGRREFVVRRVLEAP